MTNNIWNEKYLKILWLSSGKNLSEWARQVTNLSDTNKLQIPSTFVTDKSMNQTTNRLAGGKFNLNHLELNVNSFRTIETNVTPQPLNKAVKNNGLSLASIYGVAAAACLAMVHTNVTCLSRNWRNKRTLTNNMFVLVRGVTWQKLFLWYTAL